MRVLVLRPEPAATRTAEKLAALGHEAVRLSLSKAEHDVAAVKAALTKPHAAIAITSAEAARLLAGIGEDLSPQRQTPLFAVGAVSAEAARHAGFRTVIAGGGDGESLADTILAHIRPDGPILYLAGFPRAPGFEHRLEDAGTPFRTIEAYRMVPLAPAPTEVEAALLAPVPGAVLLYSRESARAFFALPPLAEAPERFLAMRLLCMSANVAAAVPESFTARAVIAAAPDEESLLALL